MGKSWNFTPASIRERKPYTKGEPSRRSRSSGRVVCPKCGDEGYLKEDSRYRNGVLMNTYLSVHHFDGWHYLKACYLGPKGEVHV